MTAGGFPECCSFLILVKRSPYALLLLLKSIFSQMPVEKQSVTEEDKEGDRELVAKNLRGEINPQAKEYVTVWEVEAGQTVRGTTAR